MLCNVHYVKCGSCKFVKFIFLEKETQKIKKLKSIFSFITAFYYAKM